MSTASDIVANTRSLAQHIGSTDKKLYSDVKSVKLVADEAKTASTNAATAVANMQTTVNTVSDEADEVLATAIEAEHIAEVRDASVVSYPVITGDLAIVGQNNSYTVSAIAGLEGNTITSFTGSMTGLSEQTVSATNNSGTFTFTVPNTVRDGELLTIYATATDNEGHVSKVATKTVTAMTGYVKRPTIISPINNSSVVYQSGFAVTSSAFDTLYASDTHASSSWKITTDSASNNVVVSSMNNTTDKTSHTFSSSDIANLSVNNAYYVWVKHTGTNLGGSDWSDGVQINLINGIEFNGFLLYRNNNDTATVIEYNWPNADGTLGERRKMEVIDAAYRNINIAYSPGNNYTHDVSTLTNFNTAGYDGDWYIYNKAEYNRKSAIPTNVIAFTNSGICSQWRNLSTDQTATYNTQQWMADGNYSRSGYAPYWVTHLTYDGGGWVIPNEFQLIVIYCCSDKLDEMDPTASSNKGKKLGYTATYGRFRPNEEYQFYWSSTEASFNSVRYVYSYGRCHHTTESYTAGVVPIRELAVAA